jgi:hypothetical protein
MKYFLLLAGLMISNLGIQAQTAKNINVASSKCHVESVIK